MKAALQEAVDTVGGVPDRSGAAGIDKAKLDLFFAELAAHAEWLRNAVHLRRLGEMAREPRKGQTGDERDRNDD